MAVFLGGDLGTGLAMDAMLWLIIGSVAAAFFLMQMIALLCSLRWVRRLPLKPVLLVCVAAPTFSFLAAPLFPPLMPLLSITATVLALRTSARHTVPAERGQR